MKRTALQTLCISGVGLLAILFIFFSPLIRSSARASGSISQRLQADNITTTGKVLGVGPSTVSNGPSVVLYSYDVPGYPRNGNSGSYTREQIMKPKELSRFHIGAPVKVEYSRGLPGVSRLKGYGTGSVYVREQIQQFKPMAFIFIPLSVLGMLVSLFYKRVRGYA